MKQIIAFGAGCVLPARATYALAKGVVRPRHLAFHVQVLRDAAFARVHVAVAITKLRLINSIKTGK